MRALALTALTALSWAACVGYEVDQQGFCALVPDDTSCPAVGGSAGASGEGGAGPGGASGTAGTGGTAGLGGGGAGGGKGPCASDSACAAGEGAGSLCVGGACTEPTTECTTTVLVVVPDKAFSGTIDREFATACHSRALDPALATAAVPGSGTTRVVVYAAAIEGPAHVPNGVRLEGRPTAPATLVALTLGASGAGGGAGAAGAGGAGAAALVTLGDKAVLAGFSLDAEGAVGVRVAAGKASLEGPLELKGGAPALAVEGTAVTSVTGTAATPVVFTGNARGVVVGSTAGLEMTGEGATGLVVEKTSAGVGVLVETGTGSDVPTKLVSVTFRENKLGSGTNGIGALEVRRNRQVLVQGCTFVQNQQSVTLNAQSTLSANLFLNVKLSGNDFTNALPAPGQGAAVCGSEFAIAGTKIQLEPLANTFPVAGAVCTSIVPTFGCTDGVDVGYDVSSTAPTLVCPGGT